MSGTGSQGANPGWTLATAQWRAMRGFALAGTGAVMAGGLVAAITGPVGLPMGSWVAAYLVLVVGVAQIGLGAGQALLPAAPPSARYRWWQFVGFNGANTAVIAGTLAGSVVVVAAGSVLLLGALIGFALGVRSSRRPRWYLALYRTLVAVLAVSIPVGVVLSVVRLS